MTLLFVIIMLRRTITKSKGILWSCFWQWLTNYYILSSLFYLILTLMNRKMNITRKTIPCIKINSPITLSRLPRSWILVVKQSLIIVFVLYIFIILFKLLLRLLIWPWWMSTWLTVSYYFINKSYTYRVSKRLLGQLH